MSLPHTPYQSKNTLRIVTAASLFYGHDAAINKDAQAIAMTSYQGGHVEYFKYMHDLLREKQAGHIKIFGGGGGTILPTEIQELHEYGIDRIYSPDDGRFLGLQGMINDLLEQADFQTPDTFSGDELWQAILEKNPRALAQGISLIERGTITHEMVVQKKSTTSESIPVLGITGTGGAGKSSLTDELILRFLEDNPTLTLAVLSVDPSKRKTGGALLGDRIRMNAVSNSRVYMRSFATRQANIALNPNVKTAIELMRVAGFDFIIVETAGIGQSDSEITSIADVSLYVMTPEFGAASQLEKIDMIDYADLIAINKFDKRGSLDALRDVRKQYQRSRQTWDAQLDSMPVYGTIASQFNDAGVNALYSAIVQRFKAIPTASHSFTLIERLNNVQKKSIIPPDRTRYLAEITEESKRYEKMVEEQASIARSLFQVKGTMDLLSGKKP